MSRRIFAALIASALGGCASTGGLTPTANTDIATFIANVQLAAKAACGVVPVAADIASAFDPALVPASQAANIICTAINKQGAWQKSDGLHRATLAPVVVNGVTIHFLAKRSHYHG